tara:strand:+ start:1840 stop:2970 length:1131 start_codon:yes stop_codon:yes gene_type:complete
MNKDEIINFLQERTGYLKKGTAWLAEKFDVSEDIAHQARREALGINSNSNVHSPSFKEHLDSNGLTMGDVKSVKFWQASNGDQRYSVVTQNQWHQFGNMKQEFIDLIKADVPKFEPIKYDKQLKDPVMLEISLPDIHYGKVTGEGPEKLEDDYMQVLHDLISKTAGLNVERILLPIGNDGMNSEGLRKSTTAGTPQDDYMGWRESFRGYWQLMEKAITYLSQFAPIDVIIVQGNHDYERMFYVGDLLEARFFNNPNITVDNSLEERKYYQYGTNMILHFHGDKVKGDKIPLLMATEQPIMWSETTFREAHLGHFHKEMLNEFMGTKVRFIPSICGSDEWHKNKAYVGTKRVGQVHIWSKDRGYEGNLQTNIVANGL